MPRGREPQIQTGGEIDPYVAESIRQNRSLAESRLLQATQEAGATSRAAAAERGATQRTAMQIKGQKDIQAAELEAQDRRAADAERARRDDREFTVAMQESSQAFQAEQAQLSRDYQDAVREEEWDRADKIYEQMEAARRFDLELELDENERMTNAILSMTKTALHQQEAREKAYTALVQSEEQFEKDKEVYETTINRTIDGFDTDKRMDLPLPTTFKEKIKEGVKGIEEAYIPKDKLSLVSPAIGVTVSSAKYYGKELKRWWPKDTADPLGVLQSQLNQTGSPVSAEDLHPENVKDLEDRIVNNKVQSEDIRNTLAVLEGSIQVFDSRIETASAESEISYWKKTKADVIQMRNSLENLRRSSRKIEASENETVGTRVNTALGIRGSSLGGRVSAIRKMSGGMDYDAVLEDLTKPLTLPALKPVTEGMTPYERRLREQYNEVLLRKYPDLGGA